MTFRVSLSARAELQLYTNALWWAENRSTEQAVRWLDGFQRELHSLADDPNQWPLARSEISPCGVVGWFGLLSLRACGFVEA